MKPEPDSWASTMIVILLMWCATHTIWHFWQASKIVQLKREIVALQAKP